MIIGLTGSIAMGKSTVSDMFKKLGIPVFDSDKQVHKLYEKGGKAAEVVEKIYPDIMTKGTVDRNKLSKKISQDESILPTIENLVHPLVKEQQAIFIKTSKSSGNEIILLDIPLLFETGREDDVDIIVVVTASSQTQKKRALERPGMTKVKLEKLLSLQMPDSEKRSRADFVIDTDASLTQTSNQVAEIVFKLKLQIAGR